MKVLRFDTMKDNPELIKYKNQIKNNGPFEEQRLITDLVAELAIALHSKAVLESENAALKLECQNFKFQIAEYERTSNDEKNRLLENVKESQVRIQEKDMILAKKDVQQLEEQKKHIIEVNELKNAYYQQRNLFEKHELELRNTINKLKAETAEINNNYKLCKENVETLQNKYIKYKSKVKYAVGIINTLTSALRRCSKKSAMYNKECQTISHPDKNIHEHYSSCCSLHSQCIVETDKIVLAELFFKQHPSSDDIENVFFIPENKFNNFDNGPY
ncbi:hypothetical protein ILUMI_10058 [Ignelater luminosus]|uniref:Uncharacterized protein n=1 Tax=Ignelater luminosus TaxID=2038154 RepID=A0A8K0GEH5_IGNLU|nr:hypothetical protein ILUMI_10058 [Ignelater luminosus]